VSETVSGVTGCVLVTSTSVDVLYGDEAAASLKELHPIKILLPEGEAAKTWGWAGKVVGSLIKRGLDRKGVVVALGGGAVGDVAGFAASVYLRGIRIVQVPTTLLGQVDSGIGGKAAVNHARGKNLIGSFHQPSLVVSDTSLLRTLPPREVASGLGEVVKYGVISDSTLFTRVEDKAGSLLKADSEELATVVYRCSAIKAQYVEADERDTRGVRAALNYGHTLGHAVETLSHHSIRHGEAVAIGMVAAARIALRKGLISETEERRQLSLLKSLGLPTEIHGMDTGSLVRAMRKDKKAEGGAIRFVLPTGIGKPPEVREVPEAEIARVLEGL
jgi:3-dehydroquinate synthase